MDGTDPKLQAMAARINKRFQPTNPTHILRDAQTLNQGPPPTGSLADAMNRSIPSATIQSGDMQSFFKEQTGDLVKQHGLDQEEKPSKKKGVVKSLIVAGITFVVSFILLVAIRPRFVMKKYKDKHGIEKLKCNFVAMFIISLVLMLIVLIAGMVTSFKR